MPTNAWKATLILSIMLPVSLLATFKMSGVLMEPQTPETVTLEAVTWNMTRPTSFFTVDEWVNNSYTGNDNASLTLGVHVQEYYEDDLGDPANGNDYVKLGILGAVNVCAGFVNSIAVDVYGVDAHTCVIFQTSSWSMKLQNLTNPRIVNPYTSGHVEASATNQSKQALLSVTVYWVFLDQNNINHKVTVDAKVTYFDGAAYQTVITPFVLDVLAN